MTGSTLPPVDPLPRADLPSAPQVRTRVVLLAGPSGSGKSSLAARLGLPTLCLDDFYKDGDDPSLPSTDLPGDHGSRMVDWDHPDSWDADRALAALVRLATTSVTDVPVYDIPTSRTVAVRRIDVGDAPLVVAEGIFAAELVAACERAGILADALCLTLRPSVTFWRRLVRDLRESRKPPLTLLRRGWALLRAEPSVVARQVALGATPAGPDEVSRRLLHRLSSLVREDAGDRLAA